MRELELESFLEFRIGIFPCLLHMVLIFLNFYYQLFKKKKKDKQEKDSNTKDILFYHLRELEMESFLEFRIGIFPCLLHMVLIFLNFYYQLFKKKKKDKQEKDSNTKDILFYHLRELELESFLEFRIGIFPCLLHMVLIFLNFYYQLFKKKKKRQTREGFQYKRYTLLSLERVRNGILSRV